MSGAVMSRRFMLNRVDGKSEGKKATKARAQKKKTIQRMRLANHPMGLPFRNHVTPCVVSRVYDRCGHMTAQLRKFWIECNVAHGAKKSVASTLTLFPWKPFVQTSMHQVLRGLRLLRMPMLCLRKPTAW